MALASPALALAATDAQSFTFPRRMEVKIQVRFYTDATAASGNEIAAADGGSRSVTATTTGPAVTLDRTYYNASVESAIENATINCPGATWKAFDLGDGLGQLNVSASGGANPVGANSYRIWLDIEPNG